MKLPTINRMLLPVKAAYFFYYFSFSSIIPFIPIFLRDVGLNAEQAGIIFGTRTLIQFFTGPIWGLMADKKRKHTLFLIIQIVVSSLFMFSSPFIPKLLPKRHIERTSNFNNATAIRGTQIPTTFAHSFTKGKDITTKSSPKGFENSSSTISGRSTSEMSSTPASVFKNSSQSPTAAAQLRTDLTSAGDKDDEKVKSSNNDLLFVIMTVVFNLAAIFDGGIPLMIDTLIMEMVEKSSSNQGGKKVDFGKQRLWGAVGYGLAAFASGLGVQLSGAGKPNYTTMFYIYLASNFCLLIACTQLYKKGSDNPQEEKLGEAQDEEKPNILKQLLVTLSKFHVTFWFATIFIMGVANGLLYGYMFWFIEDLKGSEILMGLSILIACTTEVFMFPVSRKCNKMVGGNVAAVGIAVFSYAVRFIGFSFLKNAWYILLLQLIHAVGWAMFWSAAVTHTTYLAPPGMTTTLLGVLNGVHFGVATGLATIFGGVAYKTYGGRVLYRFFAAVCVVWSVFVLIFVLFEKRREKQQKLQIASEDAENGVKLSNRNEKDNDPANDNVIPDM